MTAAHTRTDIEVSDYECAMGDCGHEVRPCPSWTEDACKECTDRSWDEHEGPVVTWDECRGAGEIWDEKFNPSGPGTPQHCRECTEGKHGACNGTALVDDGKDIVEADCICASGGHQ